MAVGRQPDDRLPRCVRAPGAGLQRAERRSCSGRYGQHAGTRARGDRDRPDTQLLDASRNQRLSNRHVRSHGRLVPVQVRHSVLHDQRAHVQRELQLSPVFAAAAVGSRVRGRLQHDCQLRRVVAAAAAGAVQPSRCRNRRTAASLSAHGSSHALAAARKHEVPKHQHAGDNCIPCCGAVVRLHAERSGQRVRDAHFFHVQPANAHVSQRARVLRARCLDRRRWRVGIALARLD